MALILKAQDATFLNTIAQFEPVSGAWGWFDFKLDESTSTTSLTNGTSLSVLNSGTAISYFDTYATFAQESTSEFFRTGAALTANKFSFAAFAKDGGQFERFFTTPVANGSSLAISSSGDLSFSVDDSLGNTETLSLLTRTRPFCVVADINEDTSAGEVTLKLKILYTDGVKQEGEKTFSGSLSSDFSSINFDIGRNSSGEFLCSEIILYEKSLSDVELNKNLDYLFAKYI